MSGTAAVLFNALIGGLLLYLLLHGTLPNYVVFAKK